MFSKKKKKTIQLSRSRGNQLYYYYRNLSDLWKQQALLLKRSGAPLADINYAFSRSAHYNMASIQVDEKLLRDLETNEIETALS